MKEPDDQMLMAYADGQLDPAQAAEIGAVLARDPAARDKVRRFRETAELARAAFAPVVDEPLPERLVAAARRTPPANVVPFRSRTGRAAPLWTLPLAASVALAVGLSGGWWLGAGSEPGAGLVAAALERAASGETVRRGDLAVTVASTFPAADGGWCRTFLRGQGEAAASGFACRVGEGDWDIRALLPDEDVGAYAPASADEPPPLDSVIDAVRGGPGLSVTEEAALIARGWR